MAPNVIGAHTGLVLPGISLDGTPAPLWARGLVMGGAAVVGVSVDQMPGDRGARMPVPGLARVGVPPVGVPTKRMRVNYEDILSMPASPRNLDANSFLNLSFCKRYIDEPWK